MTADGGESSPISATRSGPVPAKGGAGKGRKQQSGLRSYFGFTALPHLLHLRHLPHLRPLYSRKAGIRTLGLSLGNTARGRTGLEVWKRRSAGGLNLPEQIFQKRRWSFSAN